MEVNIGNAAVQARIYSRRLIKNNECRVDIHISIVKTEMSCLATRGFAVPFWAFVFRRASLDPRMFGNCPVFCRRSQPAHLNQLMTSSLSLPDNVWKKVRPYLTPKMHVAKMLIG